MKIQFIKQEALLLERYNVEYPTTLSSLVKINDQVYKILNILYDYDNNTIQVVLK